MKKFWIYNLILIFGTFSLLTIKASIGHKSITKNVGSDTLNNKPFALMEIFTSEGCSSCPPAYKVVDKLVEQGKQKKQNVLLLDFHVDYFNNLGWVDPFSKKEYTERQENYGKKFTKSGAYTPQMIVNGNYEGLASDYETVSASLKKALASTSKSTIKIHHISRFKEDSIDVNYSCSNIQPNSVVSFAIAQRSITVKISKGENAGKTLTHHNVVFGFKTILSSDISRHLKIGANVIINESFSVIAFIQDPDNMNILAADEMDLTK